MRRVKTGIPQRAIIVAWLMAILMAGCSSGTSSPPSTSGTSSGTYNYDLSVANLRPLDTTSGQYVLWLKMKGDTSWIQKPLNYWMPGVGSLDFVGTLQLPRTPDSIEFAYLSMESMGIPPAPSNILLSGGFHSIQDTANLRSNVTGAIGDYSAARASVIFTTQSSDTNQAKQEFYLMRFVNGVPTPTAVSMPVPPAGWVYGLWVLDSNFYPKHQFFYGWFRNADSESSKWKTGEYPFPGGFEPPTINDPGARLEVTLEPQFSVIDNHPAGPSPLTLLWSQLRSIINFDDTLALSNVWNSSAPQGKLTITR